MIMSMSRTDDGGYSSQLLERLNAASDQESPSAMDLV